MLSEDWSYRFVLATGSAIEDAVLLSCGKDFAKLLDVAPKKCAHSAMIRLLPTRFSEIFLRGCRVAFEQNAPTRVEGEVVREDGRRELFRASFIPVGAGEDVAVRLAFGAFNSRLADTGVAT